jgi:disease resistance protein RPM1
MLRVLDLVGGNFRITQDGINKVVLLCHLKYLNVRSYSSVIYSIPRLIGKIQGLQILDMGDSYITTLPTQITLLRNLRSIRCNMRYSFVLDPDGPNACLLATLHLPIRIANSHSRARAIGDLHMDCSSGWSKTGGDGVRVPRGIGNLKELQILESVDIRRTSSKAIKEIGELNRLRKLAMGTEGASKRNCNMLCTSIEKLHSLRCLSVKASEHQDGGLGWLISSSSPPPQLRCLTLYGYIGEMTDWFRNLTQLVKILLNNSQLKEDKTMEILGELPRLMLLRFYPRAYLGEELVFTTRAFPNLRTLEIWETDNLRGIIFKEGTSPRMERIVIRGCDPVIIGVEHLPRLKVISLDSYNSSLEAEVNAHSNRPVLWRSDHRSYHDPRN